MMESHPTGPDAMTAEEAAVCAELSRHSGRQSAIGLGELAEVTGVRTRMVQDIIAHLIARHGVPIGSAVRRPMGYFLIVCESDQRESLAQLVHRVRALARRIAALQRSTAPLVLQQLAMDFEANGEAA